MTRRSIEVDGLSHGGLPIPQASVVRGILMSGGISGISPVTSEVVAGLDAQVAQIFSNITAIVTAAGGTTEDIAKVTFFGRDRSARTTIDAHWTQMFPDPASRPARHFLVSDIPPILDLQAEIVAVLNERSDR